MPRERPFRVALIGWGAINRRVAELLSLREPEDVAIVAIGVRDAARVTAAPAGARILTAPEKLVELDPDLVLEAAGRDAVALWGDPALRAARAFIVASTSAFCDMDLLNRLVRLAEDRGSQLIVPPGALAGIDALAAASILQLDSVVHRIVKPPSAWRGTAAESLTTLQDLTEPATFYTGTAREAAARFPKNANATVIAALAGLGLDRTRVELAADPDARGNVHTLTAAGAFGRLEIRIENRALAANPKSSEMTALSLVRIIENRIKALAC
ncbi:MAG TPA: aspartate dehydrogenase [Steroidobacteraceae bacterium]|nr:aspartate dehydrogenase [Steroidobacteraceae bacterium]